MKTRSVSNWPPGPEGSNFRLFLQHELAVRCARNRRYTLRTFAHYLGIDHSTLSQLLRGRRRVTPATVRRLGAKLGLEPRDLAEFQESAERLHAPGPPTNWIELTREVAAVLGDWQPFALLELTRLWDFRPDTGWIARMLDITPDEVNVALQQLLRLGFLRLDSRDRWVDTLGDVVATEEAFARAAIDRLIDGTRAQGRQTDGPRHHSATTLAIQTDRLASLLSHLAAFEQELATYGAEQHGDHVYRVDLHCYPLTAS